MSRVLLTGARGFVGSNVLRILVSRGHEVHAVGRQPGAPMSGVTWHVADLLEPGAPEQIVEKADADAFLHLAWYAVPGKFWTAPENERWIDVTLRLLRSFGERGGTRAVMAGSCAEYAWGPDRLSEAVSPVIPSTLYGACKHATHVVAGAVADQLNVSLGWGRIFFLYGPGEDEARLVAGVAAGLLSGGEVPTTDGKQLRDFMHVEDAARAFVALLESDVEGAVNVASGISTQVRAIAERIAHEAGATDRLRLGELARRPGEPESIVADVSRLRDEVGFSPDIALDLGLADTVRWWRAKLAG